MLFKALGPSWTLSANTDWLSALAFGLEVQSSSIEVIHTKQMVWNIKKLCTLIVIPCII